MTGSIEKRGKNSYRLVVFKGYDLDGKSIRHQKTIHCKNKSEARTELAKYIAEVENGFVVEGNIPTFKEFVEIWKRDYGLKELAPSTYYRYLGILESRILPYFGHFKLNKIRPIDIMQFYNLLDEDTQIIRKKNNNGKKTRKPLSKKTILEHHRLLHAMLTKAVYWQMIVTNPADRVQPPRAPKPKRECYDEVQTRILIDNLEKLTGNDIKYKVAVLLDIFIGARLGELAGLEWSDIDLKNGIISINTDDSLKLNGFIKFSVKDGTIGKVGLIEYVLKFASLFRNPLASISPSTITDLVNIPEGNFDKITGDIVMKDNVIEKIDIRSAAPQEGGPVFGPLCAELALGCADGRREAQGGFRGVVAQLLRVGGAHALV